MAPTLAYLMAASLTMTAAVLGAPTAEAEGTFSVVQVRNPSFSPSGPLALAKAYRKYGVPLPADLGRAVEAIKQDSKRDTGSATTTSIDNTDSAYLTPVQIGTPAQTLNLDFDTGSSDLWVFSNETKPSQVNGQTIYKPGKSSTAKKLKGYTWSITFGDQSSSSGVVYTDVVKVGGLSVKNQAVEAAQKVSSQFTSESDMDGLLGLAFSSINTVSPRSQTTFFDTAKSALDSPVFTADLKYQAPGKYNFGYIDSSAYTGSIAYTPVSSGKGFWTFSTSGYAVGSDSFVSKSMSGIADTGTTLLLLPSSVVDAYWSEVTSAENDPDAGGYIFSCSATLPSFTFGIGSARIVIPGKYMNYAPYSGSQCFGGLQSSDDIGINIFGDIALKAAFVVFDGGSRGSPRLGWASKDLS